MTAASCDLFVIGAGSGGTRAARIAAGHGARVMVAEESRWGGTCVNRGCVPKKLLVYASRYAADFEDSRAFGWRVERPHLDWPTLRDNVLAEVDRLAAIYRRNLDAAGATLFDQRAIVCGPNHVRLANGRNIEAGIILIATGGRPSLEPAIPGGQLGIVSDDVFVLPELPRRLLVVGGGYIALEFASLFRGLGSEVTLVHRGENVLRGFDEDMRQGLHEGLKRRGIDFRLSHTLERIDEGQGGVRLVTLSSGETIEADTVLVATGRLPNSENLGLEALGVTVTGRGAIGVDADSRTSLPSLYAIGDVTERLNLTPVAIRDGHSLADRLFGGADWHADFSTVPTAVFTTPEVASVGLTEEEARKAGFHLDVFEARFRPMRAVIAGREDRTIMKLVVERGSRIVKGVHILGPDAAEIVQAVAIAVRMGATKDQFDATIALHPSTAEELVTMRTQRKETVEATAG